MAKDETSPRANLLVAQNQGWYALGVPAPSTSHLQIPIRSDKLSFNLKLTSHLAHVVSEFQTIDIYDSEVFGRLLMLDGHIQLTEFDERAYHESLVHVPLLSMTDPRKALVVGGGDGGVLRELCRHKSITQIDMVEIDQAVIDASKEHLPFVSGGAFEDPRVRLHIADAFAFLQQNQEQYDLIVVDCTDVYEEEDGGLSEMLFTDRFYEDCQRSLTNQGMVVSQADNLVFCPFSLEEIKTMFGRVFPTVESYQAVIPSFGGFSGYCYASKGQTISPVWSPERAVELDLHYLNETTYSLALTPFRFS